ncbi:MAG: hypothetical protein JW770_01140 [Actinobacteria bacterium]|nr:hypothetical protein [Actinomycetota bacterium]
MQEQLSKKKMSDDLNNIAFRIVKQATDEHVKNPAAVALGRMGGLKGGKARAEKLSAKKRKEIAKKAANARWNNR